MIDYKELLRKYIEHVGMEEGTDFLNEHYRDDFYSRVQFTDEEWAALQELR